MAAQIPSSFDFQHFTPVLAFQDISILSQVYLQDFIFFFSLCSKEFEYFEWLRPK